MFSSSTALLMTRAKPVSSAGRGGYTAPHPIAGEIGHWRRGPRQTRSAAQAAILEEDMLGDRQRVRASLEVRRDQPALGLAYIPRWTIARRWQAHSFASFRGAAG
jgi:hypothetical protein